jgi:hypothetical protein
LTYKLCSVKSNDERGQATAAETLDIIEEVFKQLFNEIPYADKWDRNEIRAGLESAVALINTSNPKNPMHQTLATAPPSWRQCLEVGAAAHCFRRNAIALKESDPHLATLCQNFAKFHEGQFKELAKLLTQIRPTSTGSKKGKH